jgi:dolichol-phosphate mannosyltransferase
MKVLIIIPTLNEEKNIYKLVNRLFSLYDYDILVIDDNSIDKTIHVLKKLKSKSKKFHFIVRKNKKGIGSAHLDGILYSYKKKYNYCITMDADGTHDPKKIEVMMNLVLYKKYAIINSSRFVNKKSLNDWPLLRRALTLFRYYLVCYILGTKYDSSGGFRCYNLNLINKNLFKKAKNKNYFFLIETLYILEKNKYSIFDIPVTLRYRTAGSSKMNLYFIFESLLALIALRIRL